MDRAVEILDSLPPEKNSVVTDFTSGGAEARVGLCFSGLPELRNMRCRYHRCLDCTIGSSLIAMGQKIRRFRLAFSGALTRFR